MRVEILKAANRTPPLINLPLRLAIVSENESEANHLETLKRDWGHYTIRSGIENNGVVYLEFPLIYGGVPGMVPNP